MLKLNKNKKAMTLYVEIGLYIFVFFIVAIIMFFVNNAIDLSVENQEKSAPELNYQYKSVFVKTFMYLEVNESLKKEYDLEQNEKYYVYELLKQGDKYEELIEKIRDDYVSENVDIKSIEKFEKFSDQVINVADLIDIQYSHSDKPDINNIIKNGNYVYFVNTYDDEYAAVYFTY